MIKLSGEEPFALEVGMIITEGSCIRGRDFFIVTKVYPKQVQVVQYCLKVDSPHRYAVLLKTSKDRNRSFKCGVKKLSDKSSLERDIQQGLFHVLVSDDWLRYQRVGDILLRNQIKSYV